MKSKKTIAAIEIHKNASLRAVLIREIAKFFLTTNLFEPISGIETKLQKELNKYLKFKTKVHDFESKPNMQSGKISFKDENDKSTKEISFTITNSGFNV